MSKLIIIVSPCGNEEGMDTGAIYGTVKAIVQQDIEEILFMQWRIIGEFSKQYAWDIKNALVNNGLLTTKVLLDGVEV